jgi:hypothetical protein
VTGIVLLGAILGGCAAITNPVADGVPVRLLPPEFLALPKGCAQTIPLNLLRQPPPDAYRLAPGDVLGVYIKGVLGQANQQLPVHTSPPVLREQRRLPPSSGYPVAVDANGAIVLPLVGPVAVQGRTVAEAQEAVRRLFVKKKLLKPGNERVSLTLMHPRSVQVLVLRQEALNFTPGPFGDISSSKRGTGQLVDLPAYENDVLHALVATGGLPGLDAYNEIIIHRDCFHNEVERAALLKKVQALPPGANPLHFLDRGTWTVRIPLRLPPGVKLPIRPEDVILQQGDVVFLEARDNELFYTGGLLPPGEHLLPRDRDLDVIQALVQVRGPLLNGAFGGSNLSGALLNSGLGNPSPRLLTVVRQTARCGQVSIIVDLNVALCEPQERILIQPGDLLILQEMPGDALARYFGQTFFNFNIFWNAFHGKNVAGVVDVAAPDRIPGRVGILNFIQP